MIIILLVPDWRSLVASEKEPKAMNKYAETYRRATRALETGQPGGGLGAPIRQAGLAFRRPQEA